MGLMPQPTASIAFTHINPALQDVARFMSGLHSCTCQCQLFGSKIARGRTPITRCRNFYAPTGKHHTEKFSAIPPTDPEDGSQITPNFGKFSNFNRHFSVCGPKFTNFAIGMYGSDRSLQRHFPTDDSLFHSGDIYNKVAKWCS